MSRAAALIAEKNADLDAATRAAVAEAVGIGAVKYADLPTDRTKDYVLDFGRMLSFEGNTAPYLQYAHTRVQSIFRRAGLTPPRDSERVTLGDSAERTLAIELLSFGNVVGQVAESLKFHHLAGYLYGLSTAFTAFYEQCPVLRAEETVRRSRLVLCDLTARVLATGLDVLGISAPDRMVGTRTAFQGGGMFEEIGDRSRSGRARMVSAFAWAPRARRPGSSNRCSVRRSFGYQLMYSTSRQLAQGARMP